MSAPDYVSVDSRPCTRIKVTVGYVGTWTAEAHLPHSDPLPSPVTIRIGALTLVGTPVSGSDGTQGLQRWVRIVGGAGGWQRSIRAKGYHNDAGVKARLVADDAARDAGETLGSFVPAAERLGSDYARPNSAASVALSDAAGRGVAWWVGYDGVTNVGLRPASVPATTSYQVLAYAPSERIATLTVDDPSVVTVGATISEGLDVPGTVRELEITAGGESELRVVTWLGGDGQAQGRLAGLLTNIAQRVTNAGLFGHYRYRVVSQAADGRLTLQSIDRAYPDLDRLTVWPGVAGAHATITSGSLVLVAFIGGDRAQPFVSHVAPFGADGFAPSSLTLGGDDGPAAARVGDSVEVLLPPMVFVGTVNGLAATGVVSATLPNAVGQITAGSSKVRIAT